MFLPTHILARAQNSHCDISQWTDGCWREETESTSCRLPVPLRLQQPRPRKCKWTREVLRENVAGWYRCSGRGEERAGRIGGLGAQGTIAWRYSQCLSSYHRLIISFILGVSFKCRLTCSIKSVSHQPSI